MSATDTGADTAADTATGGTDTATADTDHTSSTPVLKVVSGNPTAEEVAALTAVLAVVGGGDSGEATATPTTSLWGRSARLPAQRVTPGPGAWRASAMPH
ncbi:acyl-CoA carboxylase subunit epsilon [Ornithinimicrobium ciconiae]|uniref:Acyl-CoA carboxylase subunit epsilon n=2 Tax=Ornithinimicrobium ciconiae TaxID=2594265 RepID=A0A516GFE7_9MICO|nr:acyl-CoA carboxylase subunit epsilon [Ornithinimicrobium ciconiae]